MNEHCENCPAGEATWAYAFDAWLCVRCRWVRTEKLLAPSEPLPVRDRDRVSTAHRPHP